MAADRAPLDEVVRRVMEMRDQGRPIAEAEGAARSLGWEPAQIRAEMAKAPPGWATSLVAGPTLGFGDEIGAAIDAGIAGLKGGEFGKSYEENLGRNRAAQADFERDHPALGLGLQVAGGAALPLGGAVRGASTLAGAAGRGLATGAATGAVAGFASGEGLEDRASRAIGGTILGGVVGGALAPVAESIGRALSMQTGPGARGVARASLADAVRAEGVTPGAAADAVAAANRLGKTGVTPADVMQSGPVGGLLRDVAQSPNPMQGAVRGQIGDRQLGQYERVIGDLGRAAGVGDASAVRATNRLLAARAAAAKPDFEKAWRFDTASSPEARTAIAGLMGTDAGAKAYQRAAVLARNEMPGYKVPGLDDLVRTDAAGNTVVTTPDMKFMHFLKMGLDSLYNSALKGDDGMDATMARSIRGVRDQFRDALKGANPAYGQALDRFSGYTALQAAVDQGREAIMLPADQFREALAGMSGAGELEMFRLGAVSRLSDLLGKGIRGPAADLTRQLRSISMEEKLPALIGDPDRAREFMGRLGLEGRFSGTASRVAGNSATSEGRELSELASGDVGAGEVLDAVRNASRGGSVLMSLFNATLGRLAKPMAAAFKARYRDEMGRMLTRGDGDAEALLRALETRPPAPGFRAPQAAVPLAAGANQLLLGDPRPGDDLLPPPRGGIGLGR